MSRHAAREAALACASICEAEAERLTASTAADADGVRRNAIRALVARNLAASIRDQFSLTITSKGNHVNDTTDRNHRRAACAGQGGS
jgi:hypothetical protein